MKQLKPMGHEEIRFLEVYKHHSLGKYEYIKSQLETEKFVNFLHEFDGVDKAIVNISKELAHKKLGMMKFSVLGWKDSDNSFAPVFLIRHAFCEGLFMADGGFGDLWLIDADGAIVSSLFGTVYYWGTDSRLRTNKALLNKLVLNIAKNPELIKRLPCGVIEEANKSGLDFKQEVLTAYTARFEEYIDKSEVDADTDLTEATQSAQTELGMLKETLIKMEKELQAKHQKEADDKKTVALRKQDAISNLKSGLESDDGDQEA